MSKLQKDALRYVIMLIVMVFAGANTYAITSYFMGNPGLSGIMIAGLTAINAVATAPAIYWLKKFSETEAK